MPPRKVRHARDDKSRPHTHTWDVAPRAPATSPQLRDATTQTLFASLRVAPSLHDGLGVFAASPIERGQFIAVFVGPLRSRARCSEYALSFVAMDGKRQHVDPSARSRALTYAADAHSARVAHFINQADSEDDVNVVAIDPRDALELARARARVAGRFPGGARRARALPRSYGRRRRVLAPRRRGRARDSRGRGAPAQLSPRSRRATLTNGACTFHARASSPRLRYATIVAGLSARSKWG